MKLGKIIVLINPQTLDGFGLGWGVINSRKVSTTSYGGVFGRDDS